MKLTRLNELIDRAQAVKGRWLFGRNNELQYRTDGPVKEIKLKGSLIAAEPDGLVIAYAETQAGDVTVIRTGKLSGSWKLDNKNRIQFEVERQGGRNDHLIFQGGWTVNDSHQLVCTYTRADLPKNRQVQELVFDGYWDITEGNRLTYYLGGDTENAFRFRGAFQTKSILARAGEIRYQVGVEAAGKQRLKTITLFGKWIVSRDFGLSFEVEYGDGRKKSIAFGGDYRLANDTEIAVKLRSQAGKPLGVELILTKELFAGKGSAFVRLLKQVEESRVEAGVGFSW